MKILKNKRGFSLVELMVVVAIMGILSAIAIPAYLTYQDNAREGVAESMLHVVDRTIAVELATGNQPDDSNDDFIDSVWDKIQTNDKEDFTEPDKDNLVLGTGAAAGNWCINIAGKTGEDYAGIYGCVSNSSSTTDGAPGKQLRVLKGDSVPTSNTVAGRCTGTGATLVSSATCNE